jgi:hypothetical protein
VTYVNSLKRRYQNLISQRNTKRGIWLSFSPNSAKPFANNH